MRVDLTERRYHAVDPAHRLVAATLEQSAGRRPYGHARQLQEAYGAFPGAEPPDLQAEEWAQVTAVATAIPAL